MPCDRRHTRPVLVLQNDVGNQYAATTPVTVPLKKGEGGLKRPSMVNLAQLVSIDRSRLRYRIGLLPPELMARVDAAIRVSLDIG